MKDVHIQTTPGLTAAEGAVSYILQRLKHDADLRHHMLHTESLARLVAEESERTGIPAKQITDSLVAAARTHGPCQLIEHRRAAAELYGLAADCIDASGRGYMQTLRSIKEKAAELVHG